MSRLFTFVQRLLRAPRHLVDALFGYDVFIAHRRTDAAGYARRLVEELDRGKLASFIDVREYGPGDELSSATLHHIRKSTVLVVLGSPAVLESREPDWVLAEIDAYLATHTGTERRVIPIDFGASLAGGAASSAIAQRLRDVIRIDDPLDALSAPPSSAVLEAIERQFLKRRRETTRLRVFQGIAAVVSLLVVIAGAAAWQAYRALQEAQRNLASNYVTAARARLAAGLRDEAAALAAESLRHADSTAARRLIVENPPLDLSDARAIDAIYAYTMDFDPRHGLLALAGNQGELMLLDPASGRSVARSVIARDDLWSLAWSTDGTRVFAGDERGGIHARAVNDLQTPLCLDAPTLPERVSQISVLPGESVMLVLSGKGVYRIAFKGGCPVGAPALVHQFESVAIEAVVDTPRSRIVLASYDAVVAIPLTADVGSSVLASAVLPAVGNGLESANIVRMAVRPGTGEVCALAQLHEAVICFDSELSAASVTVLRPYAGRAAPGTVTDFAFDAAGQRLVILDGNHQALVWSMAKRRPAGVTRFAELGSGVVRLHRDMIVAVGEEGATRESRRFILRRISLDPPSEGISNPSPTKSDRGTVLTSIEARPRGLLVLVGSAGGKIATVDLASLQIRSMTPPGAGGDARVQWVGRSPDGWHTAWFTDGAELTIATANGLPLRRRSFLPESPTGLYAAAWLEDGSALVVGGGWTAPALVPVDVSEPVRFAPIKAVGTVHAMVVGPTGQVLVQDDGGVWLWATVSNTMSRLDLTGQVGLADLQRWGDDGLAVLTRTGLQLRRWHREGPPEAAAMLDVRGDRIVVARSGRRLVTVRRNVLEVHDLPGGGLQATFEDDDDIALAALSEDGSSLLSRTREAPLRHRLLHALDAPSTDVADEIQRRTGHVDASFNVLLPPPGEAIRPR